MFLIMHQINYHIKDRVIPVHIVNPYGKAEVKMAEKRYTLTILMKMDMDKISAIFYIGYTRIESIVTQTC